MYSLSHYSQSLFAQPSQVQTPRKTCNRQLTIQQAAVEKVQEELDMSKSGLRWLSQEGQANATTKKANKFEKVKNKKCGSELWSEIETVSKLIREGKTSWEDLDLDDVEIRMKWAGLFHRKKRTPGRFMMRLKVPSGILTSKQSRFLASCVKPYGEDGCADITTRANIQLRGVTLDDADTIIKGLQEHDLTSLQSGMDNVRNLTGNPLAGIDPHELVNTIPILDELNRAITGNLKGNPAVTNLPRKINVCISATRDDFPHTHINDVGYEAVKHPETGEIGFNVVVGGYFSIKRNVMSIPLDCYLTEDQLVPFTMALLEMFRDYGSRENRQTCRLMWLVESMGPEAFKAKVAEYMGVPVPPPAVHPKLEGEWPRRDILGVHAQKQEGFSWVGCCIPSGRLQSVDFDTLADICDKYGDGTYRLTCEENILFPNIPNEKVDEMLKEKFFEKYSVNPGMLTRGLVSCTGAQFCGLALIETKNRAMAMASELEQELNIDKPVRIHWTGCPNSCGQAQVGDIGVMGAPAKKDKKAVEGAKLFLGGKIGENPELAKEFAPGMPIEDLKEKVKEVLISEFGATVKA